MRRAEQPVTALPADAGPSCTNGYEGCYHCHRLQGADGNISKEGYGICVWSAGNATRPLTKRVVEEIPEQVSGAGA